MAENLKYRDYIFWWICFCAPFIFINKHLFPWGIFFGETLSHNLVAWPLLVGLLYSVYLQRSGENIFIYNKWMVIFFCGTILIEMCSILHGASVFQHWDILDSVPLPENGRLWNIMLMLQENGLPVDEKIGRRLIFFYSLLKNTIINIVVYYGGVYMIYCWYRNDYKRAVDVMGKAVVASTIVLLGYCIIEMFALCENRLFRDLLLSMDYILHFQGGDKAVNMEGWTTYWVLKAKQIRGFFPEPSFLGEYANVMSAFLWYRILKDKSKFAICCNLLLSFFLVLTSSRAAIGMQCGMLVVLTVLIAYKHDKVLVKRGAIIFCSAIVALLVGTIFIKAMFIQGNQHVSGQGNQHVSGQGNQHVSGQGNQHAPYIKGDVGGYLQSNVGSLMNKSERSNLARYTYLYVAFKTGMEHPIIGVGERFRLGYVFSYIPEWGKNVSEVKRFEKRLRDEGIWGGFPVINEYCHNFATKGIIGLGWYLLPLGIGIFKMICMYKKSVGIDVVTHILLIELLLGIGLGGLNSEWCLFYSKWVIFAITFVTIHANTEKYKAVRE